MELDHLLAGEPYLVFMGMQVEMLRPEEVALRLPLRQEVTNHLGMVHGGAQYALGEATAIAMAGRLVSEYSQPVIENNRSSGIKQIPAQDHATPCRRADRVPCPRPYVLPKMNALQFFVEYAPRSKWRSKGKVRGHDKRTAPQAPRRQPAEDAVEEALIA